MVSGGGGGGTPPCDVIVAGKAAGRSKLTSGHANQACAIGCPPALARSASRSEGVVGFAVGSEVLVLCRCETSAGEDVVVVVVRGVSWSLGHDRFVVWTRGLGSGDSFVYFVYGIGEPELNVCAEDSDRIMSVIRRGRRPPMLSVVRAGSMAMYWVPGSGIPCCCWVPGVSCCCVRTGGWFAAALSADNAASRAAFAFL